METTLRKIGYAPPLSPYIDICHEDADILICNKPSGLLSVPGRAENMKDCLETRLKEQVGEVYTVHRLDMETSGLIVYARNAEMQKALNKGNYRLNAIIDKLLAQTKFLRNFILKEYYILLNRPKSITSRT